MGGHGPRHFADRAVRALRASPGSARHSFIAAAWAPALRWFPDKRGLAVGAIAAGFGSGAAFFIPFIARLVRTDYHAAFLYTGIGEGLVIILAAQFLRNPHAGMALPPPSMVVKTSRVNFNSAEMLRTPHFYMMFAMALMMGVGGLMATAQVAPMAKTLKIGAATLTLALTINPLANGGARLFWGWVSDPLGRENTMVIAFLLQALALAGVVWVAGTSPAMFIISFALVYFTWGEVYSLFPSASADLFRLEIRQLELQLHLLREGRRFHRRGRPRRYAVRENRLVELWILWLRGACADHRASGHCAPRDAAAGEGGSRQP